jgi:catechol 2,3-dioxygenase-like lactoylglutathione lyase family enzyme
MRLSNVILRVSDMERSIAFWRDSVGLELAGSSGEFAFLTVGDSQLVLNRPEHYEDQKSDTEIVFEVDDVAATFEEMTGRGVDFAVDLRPVTSDGERNLLAAHFRDPDGHVASITGWVISED